MLTIDDDVDSIIVIMTSRQSCTSRSGSLSDARKYCHWENVLFFQVTQEADSRADVIEEVLALFALLPTFAST